MGAALDSASNFGCGRFCMLPDKADRVHQTDRPLTKQHVESVKEESHDEESHNEQTNGESQESVNHKGIFHLDDEHSKIITQMTTDSMTMTDTPTLEMNHFSPIGTPTLNQHQRQVSWNGLPMNNMMHHQPVATESHHEIGSNPTQSHSRQSSGGSNHGQIPSYSTPVSPHYYNHQQNKSIDSEPHLPHPVFQHFDSAPNHLQNQYMFNSLPSLQKRHSAGSPGGSVSSIPTLPAIVPSNNNNNSSSSSDALSDGDIAPPIDRSLTLNALSPHHRKPTPISPLANHGKRASSINPGPLGVLTQVDSLHETDSNGMNHVNRHQERDEESHSSESIEDVVEDTMPMGSPRNLMRHKSLKNWQSDEMESHRDELLKAMNHMKRHSLTNGPKMASGAFQYPPQSMLRQHTAPGFGGGSPHRVSFQAPFPVNGMNGVNPRSSMNGMNGMNGLNGYPHRNQLEGLAANLPPAESNWVSQDSVVSNETSSSTGESTESESQTHSDE